MARIWTEPYREQADSPFEYWKSDQQRQNATSLYPRYESRARTVAWPKWLDLVVPSRHALFLLLIFVLALASGCDMLNPNRQIMTRISTHLIAPSPDVERLLSGQRVEDTKVERFWHEGHSKQEGIDRVEQILRNPESLYPGRKDFLSAMAKQPAESVPANSYLRLLEESHVKCSNPIETTTFIKVRVTSGALDGHVGWVCEDDIFRTVVWP